MQVFKFLWAPAVLLLVINCKAENLPPLAPDYAPRERPSLEAYNTLRNILFREELDTAFGAKMPLTEKELLANETIMKQKVKEYEEGLVNPKLFKPSQHFFKVVEKIKQSPLYQNIVKMPKGGVLHAHDTALCSTDYVISLTYREHLWMCENSSNQKPVKFKFSKKSPIPDFKHKCCWKLLSKMRDLSGNETVDKRLREQLTLYSVENFSDANEIWKQFEGIFTLINGLLFYAPVWEDYYYNALEEYQADGVQYLEFRTTLPVLYDLNGTNYTEFDTVDIYNKTLERFMRANPDFIGSKMIYAPHRLAKNCTFEKYIKMCLEITDKYPDFVAGFDLVGQEELGRPLKDFVPELLKLPAHIKFFFHAGETNWFGTSVDENLIDAVLLGTKRIGHGYALTKHPLVLNKVKTSGTVIEVTPISNQVLLLESDLRNHPLAYLFANDYRVVISSDDPSFWMAKPLSDDFFMAFLIASAHSDLRLLKQLAFNSINFSSLNLTQRNDALIKWRRKWDDYIANGLK